MRRAYASSRSLDFSNRAHAGKLSARRFGVNAAKRDLTQRRGGAEKLSSAVGAAYL